MRIDLDVFDTAVDKIKDVKHHYLLLEERHFEYHMESYVDRVVCEEVGQYKAEDDVYVWFAGTFLRSGISGIDADFQLGVNEFYYHTIEIHVAAVVTRILIKIETKEKVEKLYKILRSYYLGESVHDNEDIKI